MRDLILAVRADKVNHRLTNHYFAEVPRDLNLKEEKAKIINKDDEFRLKRNENVV